MKPENQSIRLLGITRSKAKMYEYSVNEEFHIAIVQNPSLLFRLTIGILGDASVSINLGTVDESQIDEFQKQLLFAAQFFDAFLASKLNREIDYYLLLLGAASYYLCSLPGSASVLVSRIDNANSDLQCLGLDDLLLWILQGDFSSAIENSPGLYGSLITNISQQIIQYFQSGVDKTEFLSTLNELRRMAYLSGTDRQLLMADVISAVAKKRIENSAISSLPVYSELPLDVWLKVFQKHDFIRELWPAQHLIGKKGIFTGKSAIIQLPTSAGKTKSVELMIRSSFLSGRASIAVIVTPFRALCHEIKRSLSDAFKGEPVAIDEPSDVYQLDFDLDTFLDLHSNKKILIATPEKLTYLLRQSPVLAQNIGLLVYDEGHQFDSGTRGVTYELLLSSLKRMIPATCQTVLISAVMSNAVSIGEWLNGKDSAIVEGSNLLPTYRTIAFASWLDQLGRLQFVETENPESQEFFVPRIIEQQELALRKKERKTRVFPTKSDGASVALYLGVKLAANGSVALFCGQKATVTNICDQAEDIYERGYHYSSPISYSDQEEVLKLHFLHEAHLGANNSYSYCAKIGIFTHSRNTPEGLRLAIEYAMQKGMIKFVVCTSTLAQGVNLPIRYLIVTSLHQAGQLIKTRDFHNLLGRTGRAGMHTEGSVLFADPEIYDNRSSLKDMWRWNQVKALLDPGNSEPCASSLLSIFDWRSDNGREVKPTDVLMLIRRYINDNSSVLALANDISQELGAYAYSQESIETQIEEKIAIFVSIESYLMTHLDVDEVVLNEEDIYGNSGFIQLIVLNIYS